MTANLTHPGEAPVREPLHSKTLSHLIRIRWATRLTLAFGVAASGVANVLHAEDNPISRAISAWPPLALLLTVELISRVPVHRFWMAVVRLAATGLIAGIAGWISYWHMAAVTANYGETGSSAYLLPLTVDGLVVVASISLVELTARIRAIEMPSVATETEASAGPEPQPTSRQNEDRSPAKACQTKATAGGVSDWLWKRARKVFAAKQEQIGRDIAGDEPGDRLRIRTEAAFQLPQALRVPETPQPQVMEETTSSTTPSPARPALIGTVAR